MGPNSPPTPLSAKSLRAKAIAVLARREYARAELYRKLLPLAEDPAQLDQVLLELVEEGLLSDHRFAASVARVRGRRFGAARIRLELRNKGVMPSVIDDTVARLQTNEFQRAEEVWIKRLGDSDLGLKDLARMQRFMLGRGFSAETVGRLMAASIKVLKSKA